MASLLLVLYIEAQYLYRMITAVAAASILRFLEGVIFWRAQADYQPVEQ